MKPSIRRYNALREDMTIYEIRVPYSWLVATKRPRLSWWFIQLAWRAWWVKP